MKFFNLNAGSWGVIETIAGDVYISHEDIVSKTNPIFLTERCRGFVQEFNPFGQGGGIQEESDWSQHNRLTTFIIIFTIIPPFMRASHEG